MAQGLPECQGSCQEDAWPRSLYTVDGKASPWLVAFSPILSLLKTEWKGQTASVHRKKQKEFDIVWYAILLFPLFFCNRAWAHFSIRGCYSHCWKKKQSGLWMLHTEIRAPFLLMKKKQSILGSRMLIRLQMCHSERLFGRGSSSSRLWTSLRRRHLE